MFISLDPNKQDELDKSPQDLIPQDSTSQNPAFGSFALQNVSKYSQKHLQQILKTVFKFRTFVLAP